MQTSGWLYLIEQTACCACLLLTVGICAGLTRRSPVRLLLTSVAAACLTLAAQPASIWVRILMLGMLSTAAPLLAWPGVPRRLRLRMAVLAGLLSLWVTGLLRFIAPLALPSLLTVLLGCAALSAMPLTITRAGSVPLCATVEIRSGSQRLTLTALIDSGNLLRDVITGLPIIVISRRAAERLILLPPDGSLLPGMRLMTVRTISGTAMMTIFRTDSVRILQGSVWQDAHALIGLSPDGYDGFQALVPASLMQPAAAPARMISQGG